MSVSKIKLAIITINYNGLSDTLDLLTSIYKAKLPASLDLQIYVVDNASQEDPTDVINKNFPKSKLIKSNSNLGFAAGNNLAIKAALKDQADWLMLINNDTLISPDLFTKLITSPIKNPDTGALGGLIYFAPGFEFKNKYKSHEIGKVVWYAGGNIDWDNVYGSNAHVDEVDQGQFNQILETDFVTGAFFITRTEVLKQTGLFDEKYFMYLEDVDLSQRIKNNNFKILFDPNLKIWHKVAQSSAIGSSLNDYFITRNRLIFGLTYARWRTRLALLREAFKKLFAGTPAQKKAIQDFLLNRLGKGSWLR